jgi:imidazolonepropionase-like amidohydrolase
MLAIVGGRVETITQGPIARGTVVVGDDGRIVAVGADVPVPAGCPVIDAAGQYVLPGFVDSHSHIGLHMDGEGPMGNDVNELTAPTTPGVRAVDGFSTDDVALADAI